MTIIFTICIVVILFCSTGLYVLLQETRLRWLKALSENVKLKKALLRISFEATTRSDYGIKIARLARIRKIAEDALEENKIGLLPYCRKRKENKK